MTANSESFMAPKALKKLRIRRAIAEAQSTCQSLGQASQECALTWDRALTLQVEPCSQGKVENA